MTDKTTNSLTVIHSKLNQRLENCVKSLPSDFKKERFIQNCMMVLKDTRGIQGANPDSIARTLLQGAFLNLDFLNKECYAIVYGSNVNFQTDYKGEVKLAKLYSTNPIQDIYAKLVREGDDFEEVILDGRQTVNFRPKPFNTSPVIGVFAVALFRDGSMVYEVMPTDEIEDIRKNYSKAKDSAAWKNSSGEMYKKTALRRLCKHITLDFDSPDQKRAWDESSDSEFNKKTEPQKAASSLDSGTVIDHETGEVLEAN